MKTIEERADEYVDAPCEKNCSECSMLEASCRFYNDRLSFIAGAQSEHNLLTEWHTLDESLPALQKDVLLKLRNPRNPQIERYTIGCRTLLEDWLFADDKIAPAIWTGEYKIIGWREIYE